MLTLIVKEQELYDEKKNLFLKTKPIVVQLEHSLISMSKWEALWEKPFLPVKGLAEGITSQEEELSYIKCMIIGKFQPHVPQLLITEHGSKIREYIGNANTATTIQRPNHQPIGRKVVTTELIYFWMIRFNVPIECEKWHVNRLLTLIDVCNVMETQSTKGGKLTSKEAAMRMAEMNKARRNA